MTEKINWELVTIKELAGIISSLLTKNNISAILVGGACVSIYSKNKYMSYDLDYVTYSTIQEIIPVLEKLGFKQEGMRHFKNKDCKYYIEFLSPPVSIGKEESVKRYNDMRTKRGRVILLTATDCVKDRLAAYYHWNDPQSLDQALNVAKKQEINLKDIERWSIEEGAQKKFKRFQKLLNK
ncbi:MAG: hypothetical protein ABH857_05070 [Elusimicrobiota bacterium]